MSVLSKIVQIGYTMSIIERSCYFLLPQLAITTYVF